MDENRICFKNEDRDPPKNHSDCCFLLRSYYFLGWYPLFNMQQPLAYGNPGPPIVAYPQPVVVTSAPPPVQTNYVVQVSD